MPRAWARGTFALGAGPGYHPGMARNELLYRGRLKLSADADPLTLEVWRANGAAVAFEGGTQRGSMRNLAVGFTDDGRLLLEGEDPTTGAPVRWEGPDPARNEGQWPAQHVTWADGSTWTAATVTWTQYGVTVGAAGHANRALAGARTDVSGGQRWIIDGANRYAVSDGRRGCGCGGAK